MTDEVDERAVEAAEFEQWLAEGKRRRWIGPAVCYTHDGVPMTEDEDRELNGDTDGEPCIHILRLYPDAEAATAVEEWHGPSQWR